MTIIAGTLRGAVATAANVSFLGPGQATVAQTSTDAPAATDMAKPKPAHHKHHHHQHHKKMSMTKQNKASGPSGGASSEKASQPQQPQGGKTGE